MAMADTQDRPSIEERYLAAANTSDMTIDPQRKGQADVILAAGFVRNRLGHALIHLQSEWDRCDKPSKWSPEDIAKRASQLRDKKGRPDLRRAGVEALVWHAGAMRQRAATLTGRNLVMGLLTDWALAHGVDVDLLSPALFHWLSPGCPVCEGRGKVKIPDAPSLSNKDCQHCRGEGTWPRPLGADRVHDHMKKCLGRARSDMAGALYGG